MSATGARNGLTEYERDREARMASNQERLRSSGLAGAVVALSRPKQPSKAPPQRKEKGVVAPVRAQPPRTVKQHSTIQVHAQLNMLP